MSCLFSKKGGGILKYFGKELAGLLICLAAGFILFSPVGFHLSPSDSGIFRGGLAIALWAVLVCCGVFFLVRLLRKGGNAAKMAASPADAGLAVRTEMRLHALESKPGCGYIAKQALKQLAGAKEKETQFRAVIRKKFGDTSLTTGKYEGVLDQSMEAITAGAAQLAEQLELFDDSGYTALGTSVVSGEYRKDGVDDALQEERLRHYRQRLRELEQMLDPSEEMLLRLDRCAAEVSQLSNEATEAENERILEEIQKLIDTTKYYKDAL